MVKNKPKRKKEKILSNAFLLTNKSGQLIWENKQLFFGIVIIYGLLNLILVQGLISGNDVSNVKNELSSGNFNSVYRGIGGFISLVGTAGNGGSSAAAGAYQMFLGLITSLAVIWALRQLFLGSKVNIKEAYYKGNAQIVPFILVLLIIFIQLIPLLLGSTIYSIVSGNNIAIGTFENLLFLLILILLALVSLYFISTSIFALYIVTLPDMTPMVAIKKAKQIVKSHRLYVIRKLIYLPILLLLIAAIIMIPVIVWISAVASWMFFILSMFALVAIHTYMYTLYRELLNASEDVK